MDPSDFNAYLKRGNTFLRMKDYVNALLDYNKAN